MSGGINGRQTVGEYGNRRAPSLKRCLVSDAVDTECEAADNDAPRFASSYASCPVTSLP